MEFKKLRFLNSVAGALRAASASLRVVTMFPAGAKLHLQ